LCSDRRRNVAAPRRRRVRSPRGVEMMKRRAKSREGAEAGFSALMSGSGVRFSFPLSSELRWVATFQEERRCPFIEIWKYPAGAIDMTRVSASEFGDVSGAPFRSTGGLALLESRSLVGRQSTARRGRDRRSSISGQCDEVSGAAFDVRKGDGRQRAEQTAACGVRSRRWSVRPTE
jgi:hypothetical protein